MTHKVDTTWREDLTFESQVTGHTVVLDADEQFGGKDRGPRPKPLLLAALGGCTGMDVISILKKMKMEPSFFNVAVEATLSEGEPKRYTSYHLVYEFKAKDNLDNQKVEKAVQLSQDRYCAVSAMLRDSAELTYEISYI